MTTIRKSPTTVIAPQLLQLPFVLLGLGALVAMLNDWLSLGVGIALLVAAIVATIAASAYAMRSYRCPTCGNRLSPPKGWWYRFAGGPILFRCTQCDTDWDFGARGHED